jgi:hypothetical protein
MGKLDAAQARTLVKLTLERSAIFDAMDTQMQVQDAEPLIMHALDIEMARIDGEIQTLIDAWS